MVSELCDSPGHKIMKSYSCEEVYERMENGLCLFCEELDTPGHYHLKHKRVKIFMTECDEDLVSEDKEEAHQIQETVTKPDPFVGTVKKSDPFSEPMDRALVLQVTGSVYDVVLVHKMDFHVKEVKVLPHRSTNVNGKNIEHQLVDQIPLRATCTNKQRKYLKTWKFKFKNKDLIGLMPQIGQRLSLQFHHCEGEVNISEASNDMCRNRVCDTENKKLWNVKDDVKEGKNSFSGDIRFKLVMAVENHGNRWVEQERTRGKSFRTVEITWSCKINGALWVVMVLVQEALQMLTVIMLEVLNISQGAKWFTISFNSSSLHVNNKDHYKDEMKPTLKMTHMNQRVSSPPIIFLLMKNKLTLTNWTKDGISRIRFFETSLVTFLTCALFHLPRPPELCVTLYYALNSGLCIFLWAASRITDEVVVVCITGKSSGEAHCDQVNSMGEEKFAGSIESDDYRIHKGNSLLLTREFRLLDPKKFGKSSKTVLYFWKPRVINAENLTMTKKRQLCARLIGAIAVKSTMQGKEIIDHMEHPKQKFLTVEHFEYPWASILTHSPRPPEISCCKEDEESSAIKSVSTGQQLKKIEAKQRNFSSLRTRMFSTGEYCDRKSFYNLD